MINKYLKILFICNSLFVLGGNLLGPLYGIYAKQLGGTVLTVSISWACLVGASTVTYFILTKFYRNIHKPSHLLIAGYGIRALSWAMLIFITDISQLFIIQTLIGFGEALGTLGFDVVFAEHLDKNKHVFDYAQWKLIENIVVLASTLTGGFVVKYLGFQFLFAAMSLLATTAVVVYLFEKRQNDQSTTG